MKMPFGQYKGWELDEIPINYLLWLSEETGMWPTLRLGVEAAVTKKLEERDALGAKMLTKRDRARLVVAGVEDLSSMWEYYARWFKNEFYGFELKKPVFKIERSRRWMGYWAPLEGVLCINNNYTLPQKRFENILIHEMCHQYVTEQKIIDSSPHGRKWRNIAARMSYSTGNKITICDEEIYAPNSYLSKGKLVILPENTGVVSTEKVPTSAQEVEDSYEGFIEELSNM